MVSTASVCQYLVLLSLQARADWTAQPSVAGWGHVTAVGLWGVSRSDSDHSSAEASTP